eukprot:COSAG06_NODE_2020_length_7835_cov_3.118795_9_plen_90_part_00
MADLLRGQVFEYRKPTSCSKQPRKALVLALAAFRVDWRIWCACYQYAEDELGVAHVPPGWTEWLGLRGNSVYYDYTLSNNGKPEKHGKD